jgi:ankyrin repeat protein
MDHATFENVSSHVQDGMKRLFDPKKHHLSVWVWISDPYVRSSRNQPQPFVAPETAKSTPLHYAASIGVHDVVAFLIDERLQDINASDRNRSETPLHVASREGHAVVAQLLLENGADVTAKTEHGRTPLHLASMNGRVEVARVLLKHGAEVDTKDEIPSYLNSTLLLYSGVGHTPLGLALLTRHGDVVHVLLEHGADMTLCTEFERGSIHPVFSRSFTHHY